MKNQELEYLPVESINLRTVYHHIYLSSMGEIAIAWEVFEGIVTVLDFVEKIFGFADDTQEQILEKLDAIESELKKINYQLESINKTLKAILEEIKLAVAQLITANTLEEIAKQDAVIKSLYDQSIALSIKPNPDEYNQLLRLTIDKLGTAINSIYLLGFSGNQFLVSQAKNEKYLKDATLYSNIVIGSFSKYFIFSAIQVLTTICKLEVAAKTLNLPTSQALEGTKQRTVTQIKAALDYIPPEIAHLSAFVGKELKLTLLFNGKQLGIKNPSKNPLSFTLAAGFSNHVVDNDLGISLVNKNTSEGIVQLRLFPTLTERRGEKQGTNFNFTAAAFDPKVSTRYMTFTIFTAEDSKQLIVKDKGYVFESVNFENN